MGLADTAKALQKEAASSELLWLREMRAFVRRNPKEKILADMEKLEAYSQTPEGSTAAEQERVYAMAQEIMERGALSEFYGKVLEYAEIKERQEKGGAEKHIRKHRQELEAEERRIKKRHNRKMQITLEDMEEGEADGNEQGRNDTPDREDE